MQIAHRKIKERLVRLMTEAQACECCSDELKAMFQEWIANKDNAEVTNRLYEPIVAACEACGCEKCQEILKYKEHIVKRSQWIIGGDGASYDIGYGGLDQKRLRRTENNPVNYFRSRCAARVSGANIEHLIP